MGEVVYRGVEVRIPVKFEVEKGGREVSYGHGEFDTKRKMGKRRREVVYSFVEVFAK